MIRIFCDICEVEMPPTNGPHFCKVCEPHASEFVSKIGAIVADEEVIMYRRVQKFKAQFKQTIKGKPQVVKNESARTA